MCRVNMRDVDLSATPADSATITSGAESIKTTAGGGTVSTVAGVGQRLSTGTASGDVAQVQTAERARGACSVRCTVVGLLGGTQAGRRIELGFREADQGAFFRIEDGVLSIVLKTSSSVEQVSVVSLSANGISLERTHAWSVQIEARRSVSFLVDGEEVGTLAAGTAVLAEAFVMRAGAYVTNPSATSGSMTFDLHRLTVDVDALPEVRRYVSAGAVEQVGEVKASGGWVRRVRGQSAAAAVRYLMLFDKATVPLDGDVPRARVPMLASALGASLELDDEMVRCAAGIQVAFSTTAATLTLPVAEGLYEVDYF